MTAALLALAACNQKAAAPQAGSDTVNLPAAAASAPIPGPVQTPAAGPTGFVHDKGADLFGYYLPAAETRVGSWRLVALSLGSEDEFAKWEAGQRTAAYAPVMFEFEDVTSPVSTNELGQQVHAVRVRVLPSAYAVSAKGISFAGTDARLGAVNFAGSIDAAALKQLKALGPNGGPAPVVRGDLQVGSASFSGLAFTWFGGD